MQDIDQKGLSVTQALYFLCSRITNEYGLAYLVKRMTPS